MWCVLTDIFHLSYTAVAVLSSAAVVFGWLRGHCISHNSLLMLCALAWLGQTWCEYRYNSRI